MPGENIKLRWETLTYIKKRYHPSVEYHNTGKHQMPLKTPSSPSFKNATNSDGELFKQMRRNVIDVRYERSLALLGATLHC